MPTFFEMSEILKLNLSKEPDPGNALEFIDAIQKLGFSNPLNRGQVVIGNIIVEFSRRVFDPSNHIYFASIRKISKEDGNAIGVMRKITSLADSMGITLYGHPKPFGDDILDSSRLIEFYKKFGFQYDSVKDTVIRPSS